MFITDTVLVRLQTTNCSVFLGIRWIELTVISEAELPRAGLNVFIHSVVLTLHTLTLPSELALMIECPSAVNCASFTKDVWPLNSFNALPDFKPCIRIVWSKLALSSWEPSRENVMHVTPAVWAFSNLRKVCPVCIFQTFIRPSWAPVANISLSREKSIQLTASSISINWSLAWYFRSLRIFPVVKFQTSINPSRVPVTKYCPSGENLQHSGWDLLPNFIDLEICVGYFSSSSSLTAALPK